MMKSTTDIKSLSAFPDLCRKSGTASFGIYSKKTVSHVPSLKDDDLQFGEQLKKLDNNKFWFPSEHESSTPNIYEGNFCLVHVGLEDKDTTISISYMGTNNAIDVMTDLLCNLVVCDWFPGWDQANPQPKVHAGFKTSYEESRDNYVVERIKELSRGNKISYLQFFGHSKGGAEAMLAAYDLSQRTDLELSKNFKVSLLTFGQPHVGNKAFVDDFKARLPKERIERFVRFVNQFDPVPMLLDGMNLTFKILDEQLNLVSPQENGDRYVHHCDALVLDGYWLLDRDYLDSVVKKAEFNISTMSNLIKSIPADLSKAAIEKVSMAFDGKKHYHGSWHYIYHLELILQGKRITVDQAGNILIKQSADIVCNKGAQLLFQWGTESSVAPVVGTALQQTASTSASSMINTGSGAAVV